MSRRLVLHLLVLCLVPFAAIQPASAAWQETSAATVDLAALTLRPGDLPAAGWRHEGAFMEDLASAADIVADYQSGATTDEVAERLASLGWRRMYLSMLGLAIDDAAPAQRARSYVTEYDSVDGATAGFAFLEDESGVASAEDLPATRRFGEQSELTADRGTSAVDGRPFRSLDLTLRVGNLVAGVTLISYGSGPNGEVDQVAVEALGETLEARLLEPPAAGLGTSVVRFVEGGRGAVATYDDAYYRIAGSDVPLAGETTEAAERRTGAYASASDVYQLWQGIDVGSAAGVLYGVTSLRFPDEAAATAWLDALPTTLVENPFYANLRPVEVAGATHQTVALRYVSGGGSPDAPHAILVAVRVGSVVSRVHLVPQGRLSDIPLADVQPLADLAVACLTGGECPELTVLPTGAPATPESDE